MDKSENFILKVNSIKRSFGGLRAVDGASLLLEEGEIRGLIGPNGSGKTTLINLITGIYKIDQGEIQYQGKFIHNLKPHKIALLGIMRTFQVARVFDDMSTIDNMVLPAISMGMSISKAKIRSEELLDFVLLKDLKNEPAKNLSGGQKMLLQIARGFMNDDLKLFILDEPFAGVHQSIKGIIFRAIKNMNKEKEITFLIITHEMITAQNICNCISVLHKGRVISEGTMETIANDPIVLEAYLGGK